MEQPRKIPYSCMRKIEAVPKAEIHDARWVPKLSSLISREENLPWSIRNQRYHAMPAEDARNAKKMESDVYKDAGEAG